MLCSNAHDAPILLVIEAKNSFKKSLDFFKKSLWHDIANWIVHQIWTESNLWKYLWKRNMVSKTTQNVGHFRRFHGNRSQQQVLSKLL